MRIGKIQQKVLENIEVFQEFQLLKYEKGRNARVFLKCNNCGHEFDRYACHFNNYPHLCPYCRPKGQQAKITLEEAQNRTDQIFGEKKLKLLDYKGNNTLIDVKCLGCGEIFQSVPVSLWRGRVKGCPSCSKNLSLGEEKIKIFLEQNKIDFKQQYRFEDCKDKTTLPFDFFLPKNNIAIEFQGEQHYLEKSIYYSETLIKHDKIKREYCDNNNIKLIIIPYWDIKRIDTYLFSLKNS